MAGGYSGWWGRMGGPKEKGFITYTLSPFELKPMKGVLKNGPANVVRRTARQLPYVVPSLILLISVYSYGKKRSAYLHSKAGHAEAH
ncbi:Cytochrome b-c1 complex subunit 8 [Zancudomyces culisetae]|uniref:Cytochrome b-c1 complex subunit 8 n=1 Tax=Zancudomyces culisetae TaxID=1213189 RepID=A0A1R1PNN8_ZANCU|nr:Cytochrome b-c1 complex subunit 8 [Zancudomyces culisetae]OMH84130.1 Cytochrome b-c1 complex subunit 8 [Zancudomyces culisetae]|eukprot:OMH82523.1 Cytochrome b-c1 complex subunit 8 [Zancudomyces culisetae]